MKIPLSNYNKEFLFYDGQDRVVMGGGGQVKFYPYKKKRGGGIATLKGEGGGHRQF